ncbi:hypothetical protein BDW68DRAFT_182932 [Aspergillus falconensis]
MVPLLTDPLVAPVLSTELSYTSPRIQPQSRPTPLGQGRHPLDFEEQTAHRATPHPSSTQIGSSRPISVRAVRRSMSRPAKLWENVCAALAQSSGRIVRQSDSRKLSIQDWVFQVGVTIPPDRGPNGLTQLAGFATELPAMDEKIYKIGRGTGYTQGTYGNPKTYRIVTRTVDGEEVELPTWEQVMLQAGGAVVQTGDSGPLIFGRDVGCFTITRDLLAYITHITGVQEIYVRYGVDYPS